MDAHRVVFEDAVLRDVVSQRDRRAFAVAGPAQARDVHDRGAGATVGVGENPVLAVTVGAGRRQWISTDGGATVQAVIVLCRLVVVAHAAVHGLELVLVGQIRIHQILMADHALEIGVNRGGVVLEVDEDRDLLTVDFPRQIGVFVAHQAVFDLLGRGEGADDQHERHAYDDSKEPPTDPNRHHSDLHARGRDDNGKRL